VARSWQLPRWLVSTRTRMVLVVLITGVGVGFLFQTNNVSTSGYVVHNLENKIADIQSQNEKLATQVASYQSMASIQQRLTDENMTPAAKISYLKGVTNQVAER